MSKQKIRKRTAIRSLIVAVVVVTTGFVLPFYSTSFVTISSLVVFPAEELHYLRNQSASSVKLDEFRRTNQSASVISQNDAGTIPTLRKERSAYNNTLSRQAIAQYLHDMTQESRMGQEVSSGNRKSNGKINTNEDFDDDGDGHDDIIAKGNEADDFIDGDAEAEEKGSADDDANWNETNSGSGSGDADDDAVDSGGDDALDVDVDDDDDTFWPAYSQSGSVMKYVSSNDNLMPPRPFPHAGARHANVSWGYVADVTRCRRRMLMQLQQHQLENNHTGSALSYLPIYTTQMEYVCQKGPGKGFEMDLGYDLLVDRVRVHGLDVRNESIFPAIQSPSALLSPAKILCSIYTHDGAHDELQAAAEIWGWRCDGFFAASNATVDDPDAAGFGAVDLPHLGPEEYGNMWQKTRSILAYMYDNYLDDYDYFYLAGDDTLLIVENLRYFLQELEQTMGRNKDPIYTGLLVKSQEGSTRSLVFVAGGPGYILNRVALKLLVNDALSQFYTTHHEPFEDRLVGKCLRKLNVTPTDAADNMHRQRFHDLHPHWMATNHAQSPYFMKQYAMWAVEHGHGWKTGKDLISAQSVAFHRIHKATWLKRIAAIIYRSCPADSALGKVLRTY